MRLRLFLSTLRPTLHFTFCDFRTGEKQIRVSHSSEFNQKRKKQAANFSFSQSKWLIPCAIQIQIRDKTAWGIRQLLVLMWDKKRCESFEANCLHNNFLEAQGVILADSPTHARTSWSWRTRDRPLNMSSASSNYFTSVSLVVQPFPLQLSIIYWPHPDVSFARNTTGEIWKWVAPGAGSDWGGYWDSVNTCVLPHHHVLATLDKDLLQRLG